MAESDLPMKKLLLFGAGKSATVLIDFLLEQAPKSKWHVTVVDSDPLLAKTKVGKSYYASVDAFDVLDCESRGRAVEQADLVISLLPAELQTHLVKECIRHHTHFLSASYLNEDIRQLEKDILKAGILVLGEMGLDPGIDHMSSLQLIESIERKGGDILSFKSYCGALVAPESDSNLWHYKLSWHPRNLVLAGQTGARYLEQGHVKEIPYEQLFSQVRFLEVPGVGKLAYYPNRDSLEYIQIYKLQQVPTVIRATLRYAEFCEGWNALIQLGLTDAKRKINTQELSYRDWTLMAAEKAAGKTPEEKLAQFLKVKERSRVMRQLKSLGLLEEAPINQGRSTSADVLEQLIREKWALQPEDKDMVLMMHEVEFVRREIHTKMQSHLVVLGEDSLRTALAKTVGLPLGIATRLLLQDKLHVRGLHIPVLPEIYLPVLKELNELGIHFEESFR